MADYYLKLIKENKYKSIRIDRLNGDDEIVFVKLPTSELLIKGQSESEGILLFDSEQIKHLQRVLGEWYDK